ncbi:hypothetical protein KJ673_02095 [Patescibacteria group bacterium]|nr:hypothetical protein [Patescibacteria group bacterium]MCG2687676.1 hypothetical protein [Candidatus Parcubacteria bacterium]
MNDLSISLSEPSKRYLRSRKNYIVSIFLIVLLASICFRVWNSRDKTSYVYPEGAETTISILLTPANTLLLHNNLGQKIVLPGTGITWDNALKRAKSQISVHLDNDGSIFAITFDSKLDDSLISSFQNQGAIASLENDRLIISNKPIENLFRDHSRLSLRPIWPFFDGYVKTNNANASIHIDNEAITIKGIGEKPSGSFGDIYLPENTKTILFTSSTQEENDSMPAILNAFSSIPAISNLSIIKNESPWRLIMFTSSDTPLGYTLQLEQSMDIEDLAVIAKQLVGSSDLSTVALTLEDNSRLLEIVSEPQNTQISISTDQGSTFLHAVSNDSSVHISQTGSYISISNVDMTLISDKSIAQKLKLRDIYSFADISYIKTNWNQIQASLFISSFSSLSVSNNSITLSW